MTPRVRFAPSPTGFFHVGSARTSLFNWLYARGRGGTFVLRIEDTDTERNRDEWREGILSALTWLGLDWDEGPTLQSANLADHHAAVEALWEGGYLYACDCTREQIDARTAAAGRPGYDGHCRQRGVARDPAAALRFRVPDEGVTTIEDLVRGTVSFPHEAIGDFVVMRGNGVVLYPLANLVDDRRARITHVIRGEDLLPTTPRQVLMWQALNACPGVEPVDLPAYAHLPMLVNEQRKKLSKRKDPVALESYRDQGYLPEAMVNYLALLGWSPRGGEVADRATLVAEFDLAQVSKSPAFFDVKKLTHLNGEYLRTLSPEQFAQACQPWVAPVEGEWRPSSPPPWEPSAFDAELFARAVPLVQTRVAALGEVPALVAFLFVDDVSFDEGAFASAIGGDPIGRVILAAADERFGEIDFRAPVLHDALATLAEGLGLPLRRAQAPVRVAVTGTKVGPPLFESLELLGRERVRARVRAALAR